MGKSAKKRRQLAKRGLDLDALRGVSLMDVASPLLSPSQSKWSLSVSDSSPVGVEATHTSTKKLRPLFDSSPGARGDGGAGRHGSSMGDLLGSPPAAGAGAIQSTTSGRARKRIEFVLPRALGKTNQYAFGKQSSRALMNEDLQAIAEEEHGNGDLGKVASTKEGLDDILYPERKRRREQQEKTSDHATKELENIKTEDSPLDDKNQQSGGRKTREEQKKDDEHKTLASNGIEPTPQKKEALLEKMDAYKTPPPHQQRVLTLKDRMEHGGRLSGLSVEEAVRDKVGLRPRANSTDFELNLPQRGLCDERMVLEAHCWNLEQKGFAQQTSTTPKGFVNLGNTCFLNSTLQCLAYLPPFCQSLVTMIQAKKASEKNENKASTPSSQGQRITSLLSRLFQKVHGLGNQPQSPSGGALAPNGIVNALPTLSACGSRNGYKFRPGRQEDAHEFLVHLLDAMHDGELRSAGINQHVSGWRDRLPVPRLDETTFIHRIFGGYLRSQVRCIKCGYRSNTYDPFLDLSLEVSKKSSNSIASAFSEFTRRETLDSANRWKCSGCHNHVCATKQLTVFRPPLSLCIQLKRFTYDGGFGGSGGWKNGKSKNWNHGGSKITKPIEFPIEMDLPLSDGRSCPYMLTGIVIHVGGSASSGHYTAYVKRPGKQGKSQWHHLDDSFVEAVSEAAVLRQKDAYVLFYCRKEVKLEFPSPPPRGSMSTEEAKEYGLARARARANSVTSEDGRLHSAVERKEANVSKKGDNLVGTSIMQSMTEGPPSETTKAPAGGVLQGPVPRIKTKIHPLASPVITKLTISSKAGERQSSGDDASTSSSSDSSSEGTSSIQSNRKASSMASSTQKGGDSSPSDEESSQEQGFTYSPSKTEGPGSDAKREFASQHGMSKIPKMTNGDSPEPSDGPPPKQIEKLPDASDSNSDSSSTDASSSDESDSSNNASSSEGNAGKQQSKASSSESSSERDDDDDESAATDQAHLNAARGPRAASVDENKVQLSSIGGPATCHTKVDSRRDSSIRTRVLIDKGDSRGKVEVMLGPRKRRRTWQTKVSTAGGKGLDLLGNVGVDQWGEDDDDGEDKGKTEKMQQVHVPESRSAIVKQMEKKERSHKRKLHLDRWDSLLDQGKTKKMKTKSDNAGASFGTENPKKNVFQRIQSGIQKMNRGKAKGFFRRNDTQRGSF